MTLKNSISAKTIAAALALTFVLTIAQPRKAQAFINPVAGLVVLGGSLILPFASAATGCALFSVGAHESDACGFGLYAGMLAGVALGSIGAVVGIVLLDSPDGPGIRLAQLDATTAAKIGVIDQERVAFNGELPEVNAVIDSIGSDMAADQDYTVERSRAEWAQFKDVLSPPAYSAVQKISKALIEQAQRKKAPKT